MSAAAEDPRSTTGPPTRSRRKPWWAWGRCSEMPERDLRNMGRFLLALLAWGLTFAVGGMALDQERLTEPALRILAAVVPTVLGVVVVWTYIVFVRHVDELQRKFQLEGLAVGFGAGLVFMTGYRLFERIGAPAIDVDAPLALMILAYAVGQWLSMRRHA